MKIRQLLLEGTKVLEDYGIEEASSDAWILFSWISHMNRTEYLMNMEESADEWEETYRAVIARRAEREPLQYITGTAPFMGYEFYVDESVLIPRFDTENLVEECLKRCPESGKILDMCTGSGCILLSILSLKSSVTGVGSDKSAAALTVADKNRQKLLGIGEREKERAQLIEGDLFEHIEGRFDMIVSNPPYIPSADIEELSPEVKDHEPRMALDGTADGLYFYKRISREAPDHLVKGGWLLFEIGYDQGDAIRKILAENGFCDIEIKKDLAGLDRVAMGRL